MITAMLIHLLDEKGEINLLDPSAIIFLNMGSTVSVVPPSFIY
jgi:hypothetical protein